jgi:hypothetical protein
MTTVRTSLGWGENARKWRFEPTGNVTATNVQKAIEQVDTEAAGKMAQVGTARLPAAAATVNILTTDIEVGIDATSTAVSCPLPSAAVWAAANQNGLELTIFDYKGQAATRNITPSLNGADVFVQGVTPVIKAAYGDIKLRPVGSPVNGWYVRGVN